MKVRTKGLSQFAVSGLLFAAAIYWFVQQKAADPNFVLPGGIFGLLAITAPGGFALAGLLQLLTGVPFSEWSQRWDGLKGWQRGLIGVTVFVSGVVLLFGGLATYGYLTAGS